MSHLFWGNPLYLQRMYYRPISFNTVETTLDDFSSQKFKRSSLASSQDLTSDCLSHCLLLFADR